LRRAVREANPEPDARRHHLLRRQALLRLWPGQRVVLSAGRRRERVPLSWPRDARCRLSDHLRAASDDLLWRADALRGDAGLARRRAALRSFLAAALRLGGRSPPPLP